VPGDGQITRSELYRPPRPDAARKPNGGAPKSRVTETSSGPVSLNHFYAYMPMHSYIFIPTRDMWPASSVNARIAPIPTGEIDEEGQPKTLSARVWLDRNRPVEQMTWAPGLPMIIKNKLVSEGGWIARENVSCRLLG
jgi:hypothetical protein